MDNKMTLPLIPLRGLTIFPNMVLHFDVGREKSIAAIDTAMLNNEDIFLAAQKDMEQEEPVEKDISTIGTICKIKQIIKMPGDTMRVLVEGKVRARITEYINNDDYFEGTKEYFAEFNKFSYKVDEIAEPFEVMSEYESKFRSTGKSIHALSAIKL